MADASRVRYWKWIVTVSLTTGEALASEADVLVTGDRDLIDVAEEAPLPVLTPRAFWDRLRSEE